MTPDAYVLSQFAKFGIHQQLAIAAFYNRQFFWRSPVIQELLSLIRCRIVPGEWDEILEKELTNKHGISTFSWPNDLQPYYACCQKKSSTFLYSYQKLFQLDVGTLVRISCNRVACMRNNCVSTASPLQSRLWAGASINQCLLQIGPARALRYADFHQRGSIF